MNRKLKLKTLKERKAKSQPKTKADFAVLSDALESAVVDFKQALGMGIEIKDVDELINRLGDMDAFRQSVDDLREVIKKMPREVNIADIGSFLETIKKIKIAPPKIVIKAPELPDYTKIVERVLRLFETITQTIEENKYEPSQKADDFIPSRRVIKVGNRFIFDDTPTPSNAGGSTHGWGGGGSAAPDESGEFSYEAGTLTAAGDITIAGNCVGVRVFANGTDSSFRLNSGQTINVRSGAGVDINPRGLLTNPKVSWVSGSLDVLITVLT